MTRGASNRTGYDFAPLPDRVERIRREQCRFDRRVAGCLSGTLTVQYELLEPVHVGSGFKRLVGGTPLRGMVRSGTTPVLPGSTMKGVLRARYEAVTRSCTCGQGLPAKKGAQSMKKMSRSHPHAQETVLDGPVRGHDAFRDGRDGCTLARLCPACALFGFQNGGEALRSRVSVSDFVPRASQATPKIERIPSQWGPRLHHCGDFRDQGTRLVVTRLYGRKFHCGRSPVAQASPQDIETLDRGTAATGTLQVRNATPEELGGLLAAVGYEPWTALRVGAGKGHGFGLVKIAGVEIVLRDHGRRKDETPLEDFTAAFRAGSGYWEAGEAALRQCFPVPRSRG